MSLEASTSLVTTSGLPDWERFPFWNETARNLFGAGTLPVSGRPFFAELTKTRVNQGVAVHSSADSLIEENLHRPSLDAEKIAPSIRISTAG